MILTPTVLILGAGASYPYGFPTAKELKSIICESFANENSTGTRLFGENAEYSRGDILEFREAFWRSGQPSIDAFLERRPDFLEIGKLAIAYCLIPFEDEAKLFGREFRGGDWYEYLSGKLNASFNDFGNNKLSIITFNYDRSLEHYLLTGLQHLHGKSRDECREKLDQIRIIHVYGQLGRQPYPHSQSHPYSSARTKLFEVSRAAAGITLLHENNPDLAEAHKLLWAANRICILGFGYHPLNVERLRLTPPGENDPVRIGQPRIVYGCTRGQVGAEVGATKRALETSLLPNVVELIDADNLAVLRNFLILG